MNTAFITVPLAFLIAQVDGSLSPAAGLSNLWTQGPIAIILAWILWTQQQDRVAERKRQETTNDSLQAQSAAIHHLTRAVLVLTLRLDTAGGVNAQAREILREIGENVPN